MIFNPKVVQMTGARIPLTPPTDFTATPGNSQVSLTWTDPGDETSGGQIVAKWEFTRIVRKVGSLPANQNDGTIVVESTQKNQYLSAPYVDTGLTNDTTYYYGAFACSTAGVWSDGAFVSAVPIAGTPLGELAEGTLINIQESGQPVQFYVAKVGYEPTLNGPNRVLMVRKDVYRDFELWNNPNTNTYATSVIDTWFNSTYKSVLSNNVQTMIGNTSFPYTPGNGNNTVSDLQRSIFALSLTEIGGSSGAANVEGEILPISNTLKIAYYNSAAVDQWTRSPDTRSGYSTYAFIMRGTGKEAEIFCNNGAGYRPCFTLPTNALIDSDLNLVESYDPPPIDTPLGDLAEGTLITINESGSPVEFYVAKQGYEPTLNGPNKVLLVRKDVYDQRQWNDVDANAYATSDIDSWCLGDYFNLLSSSAQTLISETVFRYTPGNGSYGVSTLKRSVFILSLTELGLSMTNANVEGTALPISESLRLVSQSGEATTQWTRSPQNSQPNGVFVLIQNGTPQANGANLIRGSRPCFTLPSTALVDQNLALIEEVPNA